MADRTLNVNVVGLPASQEAVQAIVALHQPMDEEVESWADDEHPEEHDRRFPECPGCDSNDGRGCEGHTFTTQVCDECGYTHDGDYPRYRPWPCPTLLALAPLSANRAIGIDRAFELATRGATLIPLTDTDRTLIIQALTFTAGPETVIDFDRIDRDRMLTLAQELTIT